MRRAIPLTVALLRDWWRNREAVFFALLFPIILLVIFSTVFASGAPEFALAVQNNDVGPDGEPTNISAQLVDALDEPDPLTVRPIPAGVDLETWSRENASGSSTRVLVVPDGFAADVRAKSAAVRRAVILDTVDRFAGRLSDDQRRQFRSGTEMMAPNGSVPPARLTLYTPPDDETAAAVRGIVGGVIAEFNTRAIGATEGTSELTSGTLGDPGLDAVEYYLPAFIATIVVINGVITVTTSVANLRSAGTLKRLVATPMRRREWILANLLQQTLLALVLTAVMLVVAGLLFGTPVIPGPLAVALLGVGAVGFSAVGLTLGTLVTDPDAATSLANVIAFPLMFLSGVFWQLELMPDFLQTLARLLPLYHFHRGLRQLMIVDSMAGVLVAFLSLGAMAVLFTGLAVYLADWRNFDS